ncbi:phage tail protein [Sorangium sp. So ce542]|uniref:phage tail protein n=1 Tax=Sorangium sp. So ce542 TaxID=3133316 RepID=UPI003F5F49C1
MLYVAFSGLAASGCLTQKQVDAQIDAKLRQQQAAMDARVRAQIADALYSYPQRQRPAPDPGSATEVPLGTVIAFAGPIEDGIPEGYLPCDGRRLKITDYRALFDAIGWTYGYGGGAPNRDYFSLPDYRGRFVRGVDGASGNDPDVAGRVDRDGAPVGDRVGSLQGDEVRSHKHPIMDPGHLHRFVEQAQGGPNTYDSGDERGVHGMPQRETTQSVTGIQIDGYGGNETRPKNVAAYFLIRAE